MSRIYGFAVLVLTSLIFQRCTHHDAFEKSLFEKLDSSSTQIRFANKLNYRKGDFSVVDYLYYYNGAGVAAGDVNNDGFIDLFFVSNQNKNKLYLNTGNFKFIDVSDQAGIGGFAEWKTGVTMVDINADGLLDIYVCAVGDYKGLEGSNELYINNGDTTFTERSAEYGLDFTGFSTQAAFFDYDHDGDLDMYLVTHSAFLSRSYTHVISRELPDKASVDYLLRNDNGKFKDVSQESGVYDGGKGYGLGISIADCNNDGWEDIYVTNDFYEDDVFFINNQDGSFAERGKEYFGHFSQFSRGCDIADLNNDGYPDLMTLDIFPRDEELEKITFHTLPWDVYNYMLSFGYHHQYSRNCLQINNAGSSFSDWAPRSGVIATDWSWSALLADYDNDGYKDIFITNGAAKRLSDLDYLAYSYADSMRYAAHLMDGQIDRSINRIPEGKYPNFFFKGNAELNFEDKSVEWGMTQPDLSNGAVYVDLDNDGDLDIATNNINEQAGIYENQSNDVLTSNYLTVELKGPGSNKFGIGSKVIIKTKMGFQLQQVGMNRGFLSSTDPSVHFGIGKDTVIDSLVVVWNDQKTQVLSNIPINQKMFLDYRDAGNQEIELGLFRKEPKLFEEVTGKKPIEYEHEENKFSEFYRESLIPFLLSTEGPNITIGDVNNDGLDDFYVGGAKYQAGSLFVQKGNDSFDRSYQAEFLKDSIFEDVDALFLDIDQDHDLDLYVVTGGNEFYGQMEQQVDRIYRNNGKGNFSRDEDALPKMYVNKSCVRACDFDKDGDLDLFVGGRVQGFNYGRTPPSYLLLNDGKGTFTDVTSSYCPELTTAGMIADAAWADTDKDGDYDLIVAGDWMPIKIFKNTEGRFKQVQQIVNLSSKISNISGFWQCLRLGDFDKDGDMDFIAGNLGENTTLRKNGAASSLRMYVGDFDNDTRNDQILAYNRADGKFYPSASKEELDRQLPSVKLILKSNSEYAGKSIEELFSLMQWKRPEPLVVNQFATLYFENSGMNTFTISRLPSEVQLSKVFTVYAEDIDHDGSLDALVGGNLSGSSVYQGIYDASHGTVLKGDGKGNFKVIPFEESGFNLSGQIRDIKAIITKDDTLYLIGRNGTSLQVFSKRNN